MIKPHASAQRPHGRLRTVSGPAPANAIDEANKRAEQTEAANAAAVAAVRDIAKWITGGVALAAGGIIAGSSLTSIGSLGWEPRLAFAAGAVVVGFAGLGYILWTAIDVLLPRTYDLRSIYHGESLAQRELKAIEARVRRRLPPNTPPFREMADVFTDAYVACTEAAAMGKPVDPQMREELREAGRSLRIVESDMKAEHSRYLFEGLRRRIFLVTPVVALAFGALAWAANPGKDAVRDINPVVTDADASQLNAGPKDCIGARLKVIAYREWRSGAQDVLTIPTDKCPAARLRLDHGLLTLPG